MTGKTISVYSYLSDQNMSSQRDNKKLLAKFSNSYFLTAYQKWAFSFLPYLYKYLNSAMFTQCSPMEKKKNCLKGQILLNYFPQTCSFCVFIACPEWTYHSSSAVCKSSGKAVTQGQLPPCKNYRLLLDCLHPFFKTDSYTQCSLNFPINTLIMFQLLSKTDKLSLKPNFQQFGLLVTGKPAEKY